MNTTQSMKVTDIKRDWVVLDAKDQIFGRLVTRAATLLRGKHRPYYTPNVDCGDFVVVVNASHVKFSGLNKLKDKEYFTHSGYFGSTKSKTLEEMLEKNPEKLFYLAVRGMLPKTKLGRAMIKKLRVYKDEKHPHTAQVGKKD
ncbi:50S ribosomal protein L13 [Helicobacter ailurogastricus]|uniref:Large ribosomal subunit protein uL13 n=1 Tax=Helicobacter ailurogastricus TaxID=1578720 RepID=A0A0K2X4L2_9HELI|nr:50S ribosomal protein L13 [Helicobacter ailurogastricus]CRF40388.1 LSU ribosomal protein L13p (L13Ae) [Helicobacter ailurogastricus]CRF42549.1 LSU ribosomal protein L13p (L13Ae) [Helicobacter ailurogastricus]CRF44503.1 LSU ribosomal protein L13p (L13Ae) [Helicobacter ailurogastricus]GLH57678.1 50S ribosomal protein L13 [Helicobacter ailurogastricus]GLH59712.1 50S ribosomal protein L13 [Helicobacter ailurogastricus]